MHIALFADYYLPTLGGVQTSIKAQKEALEKAGHRVTIFCPLHQPSQDRDIIRLPTASRFKPDGYPFTWPPRQAVEVAVKELSRLGDVDVIHVHTEMAAAFAGLLAARALGIPLVQSMHGRLDVYSRNVLPLSSLTTAIIERLHHRYIDHSLTHIRNDSHYTRTARARRMWRIMVSQANYVDHVIVPSHHFAKKLQKQGVTKPLTVLSNGLEDSVLRTLRSSTPRAYHTGDTLNIMWCGRISPEKRPLEFLEAIRRVSGVSVDMYGDSIAMKSARRFIKRHRLERTVTLHGSVSQQRVLQAMQTHHVFVSSSYDFDNQPMVLLEAVAAGLPVIYCDPDLGEVLPDNGALLSAGPSYRDIAVAIDQLKTTPSMIGAMSDAMLAGRTRVAQNEYTEQLMNIYQSVSTKGPQK